jgi:hypothetical protein
VDTRSVPAAARAAQNESLFREVNERILELQEDFGKTLENAQFICECSLLECATRLELRLAEYVEVRAETTHFLVAPDHVDEDHERVIRRTDRYAVVQKFGLAGLVADEETS